MKVKKTIKLIVIGIALISCLVALYLHFNQSANPETEETTTLSEADNLLTKDLEITYPKTPRAVVKYYSQMIACMFNDNLTEDKLKALMEQSRQLYDEELLENNPEDTQWTNMMAELNSYSKKETYISQWDISTSSDVDYATMEGRKWAMVHATYTLKEMDSATYMNVNEVYLLRKDAQGKWKIYGWQLDAQS